MINEACGKEATQILNIGAKDQCLEAPVKTFALARDGFAFASIADSKTRAAWETAIENKDVVIFPYVEAITPNNTEPVIKEGRYKDYILKDGVSGSTYRMDLAICTYVAVKSYERTEYTRIFRISDGDEFTCEVLDDGKVKGQALANFLVGPRNEATDDDVPFVEIGLKYKSDAHDILKAEFDLSEMEGVYDVEFLLQGAATTTSVRFLAREGCSSSNFRNLTTADVKMYEADGTPKTATFVPADANGVYEFTGTGFATGYYISTDGVINHVDIFLESPKPLVITI